MLPAYEQYYLRFQFNKIYNFHTFPRQFLSINQSKNQTSHQSNLQYTSFELTSEEICRLLIDFPTTYRFERVDSTGWHFSLVFPTLPPPSPPSVREGLSRNDHASVSRFLEYRASISRPMVP